MSRENFAFLPGRCRLPVSSTLFWFRYGARRQVSLRFALVFRPLTPASLQREEFVDLPQYEVLILRLEFAEEAGQALYFIVRRIVEHALFAREEPVLIDGEGVGNKMDEAIIHLFLPVLDLGEIAVRDIYGLGKLPLREVEFPANLPDSIIHCHTVP